MIVTAMSIPVPDSNREISGDGEQAKNSTTESSHSGNDTLEFLVRRHFTMTGHYLHTIICQDKIKERGGGIPPVDPSLAWQRPEGQSKSSRIERRRRA